MNRKDLDWQRFPSKNVAITNTLSVRRALPQRQRRLIGPWCFLDHFGPHPASGMIGPHPHCGLQTVTWLLSGQMEHLDSLGHVQTIRPSQLNLMTAGSGLCHAEKSVEGPVEGLQLWIAAPSNRRADAPCFEHHDVLPQLAGPGYTGTLLLGTFDGKTSPGRTLSPTLGIHLRANPGAHLTLPLDPRFEYGLYMIEGSVRNRDQARSHDLMYLGSAREELRLLVGPLGAEFLLFGGAPMTDPVHMHWNFVTGTREEGLEAARQWNAGERFGSIPALEHARISAPVSGKEKT